MALASGGGYPGQVDVAGLNLGDERLSQRSYNLRRRRHRVQLRRCLDDIPSQAADSHRDRGPEILTAFAYPATQAAPNNVPIAVVGPEPAVQQISAGLAQQGGEDRFDLVPLFDREAAEQAISDREVYGAIVLAPQGGEMLIASAASPAVTQISTGSRPGYPQRRAVRSR